ncbi:MAG: hypothetical protein JXB49_22445 [Bacteroidales bacterium]|nr:hypothetical protein [Bacteroidales bacterium]
MFVKKFICSQCGAAKVNSYKNPYVVCDYCGNMIDVDYSAGYEVWTHDEAHTQKYLRMKEQFKQNMTRYLSQNNEKKYWEEQFKYWDFYYQHFPEYLPPTVSPGEIYRLYIKAAADISLEEMRKTSSKESQNYNNAYKRVRYYNKDNKTYVNYDSFIKMIDAYIDVLRASFSIMYNSPEYQVMHKVLPKKLHVKLKLSQIAQTWIPYLQENEKDNFLTKYALKHEYAEVKEPKRFDFVCEACKSENHVPVGALVCICEKCRHQNILKKKIVCPGCGSDNDLPEDWEDSIFCSACNIRFKVVQPLFG